MSNTSASLAEKRSVFWMLPNAAPTTPDSLPLSAAPVSSVTEPLSVHTTVILRLS